jgi:hypothetical protein
LQDPALGPRAIVEWMTVNEGTATTLHAAGTFDIDAWDEQPWDEGEGARLTRVRVTKTSTARSRAPARPSC